MDSHEPSILIVDDEQKDLVLVEQSLAALGFRLSTLQDPHHVLHRVESERPDLVILDALLPGLSGFDLCKQIKSAPDGKSTLVVILTGVYLKEQIRREAIHQFKADGFMTKPYRPTELQRLVLRLLAKKLKTTPGQLRAGPGQPGEEVAPPEPEQQTGWWARLWAKLKPTPAKGLELSPHDEVADGEGAAELREPEELPAVEEGDASRVEESVAEARETDAELEEAPREFDVLEESEALPVPTLTEESRELAEDRTLAPTARYKGRRPSAIHKGVPVYDEEDFLYELGREISRCQRVGRPLTLILIRVSDLDQIVEMFGGGFRRQVLWHVAEQALESLREVDLAGQLSSEEVVGLIAFASGPYGGRRIVSRVKRTVRHNPFNVGEGIPAIVPALRFGMATFPKEAQDLGGLLDRAHRDLSS